MSNAACIIIGFALLAVLLAFKKPIWLVLLVSSIVMGLIGLGAKGVLNILTLTITDSVTVDLLIITFLIATLIGVYRSSGFLNRLGDELVKLIKRPKLIVTLVPAVLGLLPVAGGALMSAPIVDVVGRHIGLSRKLRLFINVWFRHIIFLVYPLSTVLVTTAALAGVSMWELIVRELPILLAMILAGYVVGFRGVHGGKYLVSGVPNKYVLLKVFSPIALAIVVATSLRGIIDGYLHPLIPITRYSMILGLVLAIALLTVLSKVGLNGLVRSMASRTTLELVVAAFAALLLRNVFVSVGGPKLISEFVVGNNGLSPILMLIIPAAISLATGSPMTGNVVSLSIFQPLGIGLHEVALIYTSAMLGYIASPAHLCYVYTAQYLNVPMSSTFKEMSIATAITLMVAIAIYLIL